MKNSVPEGNFNFLELNGKKNQNSNPNMTGISKETS